jgi:hypothetical protein
VSDTLFRAKAPGVLLIALWLAFASLMAWKLHGHARVVTLHPNIEVAIHG